MPRREEVRRDVKWLEKRTGECTNGCAMSSRLHYCGAAMPDARQLVLDAERHQRQRSMDAVKTIRARQYAARQRRITACDPVASTDVNGYPAYSAEADRFRPTRSGLQAAQQ